MRKSLPLTFLILAGLFLNPTVAYAHAGVISSNPTEGQVLTEMAKEISVTFSDELLVVADKEINTLKLTRYDGPAVLLENLTIKGNVLTASVTAGDYQPGLYEIAYRVISADGHEVSDLITFSLDTSLASPASSAPPEAVKSESEPFALPLPIVLAIALLIVAGGFFALERRRRAN